MKVLIVDDNHMICRCLEQQIHWKEIGCQEPKVAHNGADAIQQIELCKPDVVISDVRMPVMDGMELCKQINTRWPEITIIFMSAYEDFAAAQMAIRYNVKDYILKPLDRERLASLEQMLKNVVKQRANVELYRKIISDQYLEYLTTIVEEKDTESLEEFLEKLSILGVELEKNGSNLWAHLFKPLFAYRYALRNQDARVLNQEEQRVNEEILTLSGADKISYLRNRYLEIIKEEENEAVDSNIIGEIQKVVQEQFASPSLNIHKLGRIFHMSPTYLGRIYVERTGMRLVDYISEKRMQYACEQLVSSVKTVKEIAESSGYPDANYFARAFKRKMNMTPVEYRTKYRKLNSKKLWEETNQK